MTIETVKYVRLDQVQRILSCVSDENVEIAELFRMQVDELQTHEVNFGSGPVPPLPGTEWDGISRCCECGNVHSPNVECAR